MCKIPLSRPLNVTYSQEFSSITGAGPKHIKHFPRLKQETLAFARMVYADYLKTFLSDLETGKTVSRTLESIMVTLSLGVYSAGLPDLVVHGAAKSLYITIRVTRHTDRRAALILQQTAGRPIKYKRYDKLNGNVDSMLATSYEDACYEDVTRRLLPWNLPTKGALHLSLIHI